MDDKKAATDIVMMVIGPIAAIVFSMMRTAYDSDEPRVVRMALEAGVCAGITVTAMATVLAATEYFKIGLSYETMAYVSAGIGSFVGWIGANEIRKLVLENLKKLRPNSGDES